MRLTSAGACVAAAVALAACGNDGGGGSGGPEGPFSHPTGADDVVVRVATGGGFVPVESRLAEIPEITIYGDGRMIVVGPTTQQFPGPALPNLQEGRLTREQLQDVLGAAAEAGLLGDPPDYGDPQVTDLPTTRVTVNADGDEHDVGVYALQFEEDAGLTGEQREARRRLNEFIRSIPTDAVDARYEPQAVDVFVRPYEGSADPGLEPTEADWPLGDLVTGGEPTDDGDATRCVVVTGADAETVLAAAAAADTETRWRAGGAEYSLVFRPLLPDETGCDAL